MNYSFKDPKDVSGTITSGNFTQLHPDTPIMVGKKLTILGGNFTNVRKDPAWEVNGGLWMQVSRCSHLHPELVPLGLPVCPPQCEHVVGSDQIIIDDQVVNMVFYYEDKVVT